MTTREEKIQRRQKEKETNSKEEVSKKNTLKLWGKQIQTRCQSIYSKKGNSLKENDKTE